MAKKRAKNSNLKQATHRGTAIPRSAQSGLAVVPASVATLPPGLGPPMSSTPVSAVRGLNTSGVKRRITSKPLSGRKTVRVSSLAPGAGNRPYGGTTVWKADPNFRISDVKQVVQTGGTASLRGRNRRGF